MLIIVSSPAVPKLTAIDGTTRRIVSAATPGSEDVKGGYEDGSVVRVGGVTHLFVSELYHAPPPAGGYDDVHMRLGHWSTSGGGESAAGWKREGTLVLDGAPLYSTANCSSSSVGDHNASIWSPTATFDRHRQQWCVASVGYDCINEPAKHVKRPRSGAIRLMCSTVGGLGGVGGPFERVHVPGGFLLSLGNASQGWEGVQGVDSFWPYVAPNGTLLALYGSSPFHFPWNVGLVASTSGTIRGPWTRLPNGNPLPLNGGHVENPVVYRASCPRAGNAPPATVLLMLFDWVYGQRGLGFSYSSDGYSWVPAEIVHVPGIPTAITAPLALLPSIETPGALVAWFNLNTGKYRELRAVQLKLTCDMRRK